MDRVLHILFSPPDHRLLSRSLQAFVLGFAGSITLVCIALAGGMALGLIQSMPESPAEMEITMGDFLGVVILAPVVETLLLGAILGPLRKTGWPPAAVAMLSALIWGGLHGLLAPFWFFGTVFSFFVFSSVWLTWRARSLRHAFLAAMLPHAINNLAVFLLVAFSG